MHQRHDIFSGEAARVRILVAIKLDLEVGIPRARKIARSLPSSACARPLVIRSSSEAGSKKRWTWANCVPLLRVRWMCIAASQREMVKGVR